MKLGSRSGRFFCRLGFCGVILDWAGCLAGFGGYGSPYWGGWRLWITGDAPEKEDLWEILGSLLDNGRLRSVIGRQWCKPTGLGLSGYILSRTSSSDMMRWSSKLLLLGGRELEKSRTGLFGLCLGWAGSDELRSTLSRFWEPCAAFTGLARVGLNWVANLASVRRLVWPLTETGLCGGSAPTGELNVFISAARFLSTLSALSSDVM